MTKSTEPLEAISTGICICRYVCMYLCAYYANVHVWCMCMYVDACVYVHVRMFSMYGH